MLRCLFDRGCCNVSTNFDEELFLTYFLIYCGLTAGVTCRQRMLTPPWRLIPSLDFQRSVFSYSHWVFYMRAGCFWRFPLWYLWFLYFITSSFRILITASYKTHHFHFGIFDSCIYNPDQILTSCLNRTGFAKSQITIGSP